MLGRPERDGSVTLISAVSPPGGDFSEPVTQACLRVAGALWALDAALAHQRQFPAVDWETSYSLYADAMARWFDDVRSIARWSETRARVLELLQRDAELREIAGLVGPEALEDEDRLVLAAAGVRARVRARAERLRSERRVLAAVEDVRARRRGASRPSTRRARRLPRGASRSRTRHSTRCAARSRACATHLSADDAASRQRRG